MPTPRSAPDRSRLDAVVEAAVTVGCIGYVALFLGIAMARLDHPYELEWMAGAFLDHVDRIRDGELLYAPPSMEFVAYLYTPLFCYCSALLAEVLGDGFLPLRLVSLTATLVTLAAVFVLVRRETDDPIAALTATGLFAACYHQVESWFDLARVDNLFLALATVALTVLLTGRGARSAIAAAVVLAVGYYAKQTAFLLAPAFAVAVAFRAPRRAILFGLTFGGLWGSSFAIVDAVHDGWFSFYTWTLPRQHEYDYSLLGPFLGKDLLPFAPSVALAVWAFERLRRDGELRLALLHGAWVGGAVVAAGMSRLHVGGAKNVLLPGFLGLAVLGALAFGIARRRCGPTGRRVAAWLLVVQLVAMVWDPFHGRIYDPNRYVPTAADRAAGDALVELLAAADGPVFVPVHGHYPRLAGKQPTAHVLAVLDVMRGSDEPFAKELEAAYWNYARDAGCEIVVLNEPGAEDFVRVVQPGFRVDRVLHAPDSSVFFPPAGLPTRPQIVFRRVP